MKGYIIIDEHPCLAQENMAYDDALFHEFVARDVEGFILRIYRWKAPSCSYGYAQRINIYPDIVEKYKGSCVRRPTGGGIVFHDADISYSIITKFNDNVFPSSLELSYKFFHEAILDALHKFNINAFLQENKNKAVKDSYYCFEKPVYCDIIFDDKKIVGSAQKRLNHFLLQQGNIKLDIKLDFKKFVFILKNSFEKKLNIDFEERDFFASEKDRSRHLIEEKYLKEEWNFKF